MMRPSRKTAPLAAACVQFAITIFAPAAFAQSRVDGSGYALPGHGYDLPAFCRVDHRARGAAIGAAIGEARGGAYGARIGARIGAARGERIDALCRRIATLRAAARAAPEPHPAAPSAARHSAVTVARPPDGSPQKVPMPAPQTAAVAPLRSDQPSQAVAPLTDTRAAAERCMVSLEVSFAPEHISTAPVTGQVCEDPDGRLREEGSPASD